MGRIKIKKMKINKLVTITIIGLALVFSLGACGTAPKTVTQQITQETTDPYIISRAAYADALEAYIVAGQSYINYKSYLDKSNPELSYDIWFKLHEMNRILKDWKRYSELGQLPSSGDMNTFHEYRRLILQIILEMEAD